jgi:hypothetical protein
MGVVHAAPQLQVGARRRTIVGERHDVMELQQSTLSAAAGGADERTLTAVTLPQLASHGPWHITRPRCQRASWPRTLGVPRLLLNQVVEQQRERTIEDRRDIAVA